MSDLWPFSSSSPPPIIHHSSLSQSSPFISSPPPLSSPSSPRNHGNPHSKVPSYHLIPQTQLSSPHHTPHPQVTSPHFPEPQVTSLHLPYPQVTSPHLHQPHVISPHLFPQAQATSPHLPPPQVTSPHFPHPQATSPHLPPPQVTSPHFPHPQVTSPHLVPQTQVSSSHQNQRQVTTPHFFPQAQATSPYLHQPQVTSPHLLPQAQVTSPNHPHVISTHLPHPQVTSPHHLPHPQVTSPHHLPHPQVTSPHHLPHSQVTSTHFPHPQVTSPHLVPQTQVTSPHFVPKPHITSPHLLSPPLHLYNQNHDPGLENPDWSRCEAPFEHSYLLKSYSHSHQNQTTAHLDLHLQNQNKSSTDVAHHRDELENTHRLPYNTHTLLASGMHGQGDTPGPVQDTWRPLGQSLSQLQCSPLGSMSGDVALGRWNSVEGSSSPAEDFSSTQFFHDSCHDNNALQPFCSPNTPGPSPHYPQTPTISSPGPQMHPREERLDFHTQTSRQLNRNKTLSFCLHEYDSYPMISDLGQHHPHQTSQPLLQSQSELVQDQTGLLDTAENSESCFSPQGRGQDVSSAAQSPGLPAGLSWREECGRGGRRGGGGGGRRRGGGDSQPDRAWMKQPENSMKVLDCRLLCTVCKRDFKSLPALNGHMRSHSGSRSSWLNKGENSPSPVQPSVSMVIPVSVPVQSRGTAKACRGRQRRSSRLSPATGGAVLYRSLLHVDEEEAVAKGDGAVSSGGDEEVVVEDGKAAVSGDGVVARADGSSGVHYTPPPMLCPLRAGQGLYCSLTTRRQQRVQTVHLHNTHNGLDDLVAMETASPHPGTLTGINKPWINVGRGFQAEIPPLLGRKYAHSDSHSALLLWTPWDELERPVNQHRVEALLTMVRSSVVPGVGASPDSALHVLSECRGDFLLTVEKLLSTPETSNKNHAAQQYPSVSWSAAERRLLVKSLQLHHKDFSRVQKAVQTKSVSQCVEFYYLWKKKLSLSARTPAGLTVTLPDTNGQRSSRSHNAS